MGSDVGGDITGTDVGGDVTGSGGGGAELPGSARGGSDRRNFEMISGQSRVADILSGDICSVD